MCVRRAFPEKKSCRKKKKMCGKKVRMFWQQCREALMSANPFSISPISDPFLSRRRISLFRSQDFVSAVFSIGWLEADPLKLKARHTVSERGLWFGPWLYWSDLYGSTWLRGPGFESHYHYYFMRTYHLIFCMQNRTDRNIIILSRVSWGITRLSFGKAPNDTWMTNFGLFEVLSIENIWVTSYALSKYT